MSKRWRSYYWLFLKELGRECYSTWRQELAASVVTILFYYAIARNDFDLWRGLESTVYTLALFVIWHTIRTPWLLYKKERVEHLDWYWGMLGVVFAFGTLALIAYGALWFYTMQPKVTLTMSPDGKDKRIVELEAQVSALERKVPDERSLKVRALQAADEFEQFWRKQPKQPTCTQTSSMTPQEQQKALEPCAKYFNQRTMDYQRLLAPRIMEIVQEFKAKGVDVLNIENCASTGFCGIPLSVQLRAFSLRLDAQDHLTY